MRRALPLLVLAAVLVAPLALLVPVFLPGEPPAAVLTSADRAAIGDPGVERGADPAPVAALPSSAAAVAVAHLRAAHAAGPDDTGRSRRDAVAHAEPGSPAAAGTPVLDPPGPGERRIAEVDALEPAGSGRGRTAFVATVRTTTAAPGATPRTQRWRTRVVLRHGPDGRWRVTADAPITPDTPDVGD
ncbi:hypothetical protein H7X46_02225 [Pseudonocardia sp. C8]|uniref:hypothetical protein n=1 Tax=Pseudonocardia sp. C8 TaxID=2762759 RepID=UPI001642F97A|nr:hypothetical protein [Pseudonocardia sp. C8]MBC3189878.1 hypothetical protein [Pseudonocardia sp. C8]